MIQNLIGKKIVIILIVLFVGMAAVAVYVSQKDDGGGVIQGSTNNLTETDTTKTQPDSTDRSKEQKHETVQDVSPTKKDVLEETRKLLVAIGKLPNNSTIADVRDYVTPPLQNRPFVYYCDKNFILQSVGGEYHKLEYYSSSFRKTNECEATFAIGSVQPYPASCVVASTCKLVKDFIYPLILKTDKSSYKYGDEITVTLASNPNRNESMELVGAVSPYCAGLHLERIGKSSQDWIRDSISRPGSGGGAGCPHKISIVPGSPYEVKVRIDDTGAVPPGKWRIVHESEIASLETGFWLDSLNQEQFGCHVSGGTYVGCPASGGTGLCIPCSCPEGFSWSPTEKQCLKN